MKQDNQINREPIKAINWNTIEDDKDKEVWDRLVGNFWLPEKIPVANDIPSWNQLTASEQDAVMKVFTGLTLLDTIQGNTGAVSLLPDARTPHEESVLANIHFMEAFSGETQLLTTTGWKKIVDITEEDKVAQVQPGHGVPQVSYATPTIVPSHKAEEVYEFHLGGTTKQVLSGGHRMLLIDHTGKPLTMEARYVADMIETGDTQGFSIPVAGTFMDESYVPDRDVFDLLAGSKEHESSLPGFISDTYEYGNTRPSHHGNALYRVIDKYGCQPSIGASYLKLIIPEVELDAVMTAAALSGRRLVVTGEDEYHVSVELHQGFTERLEEVTVKQVESRQVYCVQVPSTYLVTRNGGVSLSGNCVHAKSYSNIFMTLSDTPRINEAFAWSESNKYLQYKGHRIRDIYFEGDALQKKIASVLLESFLFYSGFYLPFRMSSMGKLTNTADIIRLITRDEIVHSHFIGLKFQVHLNELSEEKQEEYREFTMDLLLDLYDNELEYTQQIYDPLGWTEDVKKFLRYNANKALNNLGYDGIFPADTTDVSPAVLSSMSSNADENHDFFSGSGSSYVIGDVEVTEDDDWDF